MTSTNSLTDQQLDEIDAREKAATPGPWEEHTEYGPHFYAYLRGPYLRGVGTLNFGDGEDAAADREFVTHARTDVPALLNEVRRLSARVVELEETLPRCGRSWATSGNEYPPCARPEGHPEAYCRSADGRSYFLAAAETHVVADDSDDPEHVDDCPGCKPAP